jgi:hypothetical protein
VACGHVRACARSAGQWIRLSCRSLAEPQWLCRCRSRSAVSLAIRSVVSMFASYQVAKVKWNAVGACVQRVIGPPSGLLLDAGGLPKSGSRQLVAASATKRQPWQRPCPWTQHSASAQSSHAEVGMRRCSPPHARNARPHGANLSPDLGATELARAAIALMPRRPARTPSRPRPGGRSPG